MIFKEVNCSLLDLSPEYHLAHCISKDCAMGTGVARDLCNKYLFLRSTTRDVINTNNLGVGSVVLYAAHDNRFIFNLVTKLEYYHKPFITNLIDCLYVLRNNCSYYRITKLGIPLLGCGNDRLDWEEVREHILEIFSPLDIEIIACRYDKGGTNNDNDE